MIVTVDSDFHGQTACVAANGPYVVIDVTSDRYGDSLTVWKVEEAERIAAALLQAVAAIARGAKEAV